MFDMFFPDRYVASAYVINYEKLYEEGVRGLIFDIDNTLVPHGAPADRRAKELEHRMDVINRLNEENLGLKEKLEKERVSLGI